MNTLGQKISIVSIIDTLQKIQIAKKISLEKQEKCILLAEQLLTICMDLRQTTTEAEKQLMETEKDIRELDGKISALSSLNDDAFIKGTEDQINDNQILVAEAESLIQLMGEKREKEINSQDQILKEYTNLFDTIQKYFNDFDIETHKINAVLSAPISPKKNLNSVKVSKEIMPKNTPDLIQLIKKSGDSLKFIKPSIFSIFSKLK